MKHIPFFFTFLFSVFLIACSGSPKLPNHLDIKSLDQDAIVLGTGGGFSGFYDGAVITRNGDVYSWRAKTDIPDELVPLFRTSRDSAGFFFRYLDEMGFADMKTHSAGNMNSFVELRSSQANHRIGWSSDEPANDQALTTFYSFFRKFIQRETATQK